MLDLKKYLILLENSSAHGLEIDNMMVLVHWLMLLLFLGWGAFFIYTLFKFNSYNNPKANYHGVKSHFSSYAEIGVIVFECVLIIGFAIPLWASLKTDVPEKSDLEIRVIAQQFKWNIHYPGADGIFGKTDPGLINDSEGNFFGHTISNRRDRGLSSKVDMVKLYNKVKFLKEINAPPRRRSSEESSGGFSPGKSFLRLLMCVVYEN